MTLHIGRNSAFHGGGQDLPGGLGTTAYVAFVSQTMLRKSLKPAQIKWHMLLAEDRKKRGKVSPVQKFNRNAPNEFTVRCTDFPVEDLSECWIKLDGPCADDAPKLSKNSVGVVDVEKIEISCGSKTWEWPRLTAGPAAEPQNQGRAQTVEIRARRLPQACDMVFDARSTDALVEKLERERCKQVEMEFLRLGMSKAELDVFKEARDQVKAEIESTAANAIYDPGSLLVSGGLPGDPSNFQGVWSFAGLHNGRPQWLQEAEAGHHLYWATSDDLGSHDSGQNAGADDPATKPRWVIDGNDLDTKDEEFHACHIPDVSARVIHAWDGRTEHTSLTFRQTEDEI
eukprot:SAG22_NODE_2871_length_2137_cov_1.993131_2_plen_341_part_01